MRSSDVATIFGVSPRTIQNWTKTFADFLSPSTTPQRTYTDADVTVFATVNSLKRDGYANKDILVRLADGYRVEAPPNDAMPQFIDATQIRLELETTRRELQQALTMLEASNATHAEQQTEITRLNRELGRAEGELLYLRKLAKVDES